SLHSYPVPDAMFFSQLDTLAEEYSAGAPLGAIDRIFYDGSWQYVAQFYNSWDALIQERLLVPASVDISLTSSWNSTTRNISAQLTASLIQDLTSGDYRMNLYVIEDSVTGAGSGYDQDNFYDTDPGNPFYGMGNPIEGFVHRHVVRAILPSSWGQPGIISNDPSQGESFTTSLSYTLPVDINESRVYLVGFV